MKRLISTLSVGWFFAAVFFATTPCSAQVAIGDEVKMNLSGSLGFGYGGAFGDAPSTHDVSLNGNGQLSGYYYNPNFLSFTVQPYYNRNQANSLSQSIFNESGINSTVNIFNGSHFPGYVSYGKDFNNTGEFGVPGITGLTTEGSGQSFGVGWSVLFPDRPTLAVAYNATGNSSSVLGADGNIDSNTKTLNVNSQYRIGGWDLNGNFVRQSLALSFPAFISSNTNAVDSSSSSNGYNLYASHMLPMSGNISAEYAYTNYDSTSNSGTVNGSTSTSDVMATINPTTRLNLTGGLRYTGNVAGSYLQSVVNAGGNPVLLAGGQDSRAVGLTAYANYNLGWGFMLHGRVNRQTLFYQGKQIDLTQYGGTVSYSYSKPLFGLLYFSFGMVDNAQEAGNTGMSYTGNVGMKKNFGRWETSSDFGYTQSLQTLNNIYTVNSLTSGAFARRRLSQWTYWSGTYRYSKSGLLQDQTSTSRTHSVSTTFNWHSYTLTGNYSDSTGRSVLTASGLLNPSPIPIPVGDDVIFFDGKGYGVGIGMSPLRRLTITGNYTYVKSDTQGNNLFTTNNSERYYSRLDYSLRKLVFRAGYSRTYQGLSATGIAPVTYNSYFFGLSRWFNVF